MKALTIHQPWASLIAGCIGDPADGIVLPQKTIENRSWKAASIIGEIVAIHAGKKHDTDAVFFARQMLGKRIPSRAFGQYPHGAFVATCRVVAFANGNGNENWVGDWLLDENDLAWLAGPIGWVLRDIVPVRPIPYRGYQGLWTVPEHIASQLMESRHADH